MPAGQAFGSREGDFYLKQAVLRDRNSIIRWKSAEVLECIGSERWDVLEDVVEGNDAEE